MGRNWFDSTCDDCKEKYTVLIGQRDLCPNCGRLKEVLPLVVEINGTAVEKVESRPSLAERK